MALHQRIEIRLFIMKTKFLGRTKRERERNMVNVMQWHMKVIYPSENDVASYFIKWNTVVSCNCIIMNVRCGFVAQWMLNQSNSLECACIYCVDRNQNTNTKTKWISIANNGSKFFFTFFSLSCYCHNKRPNNYNVVF